MNKRNDLYFNRGVLLCRRVEERRKMEKGESNPKIHN